MKPNWGNEWGTDFVCLPRALLTLTLTLIAAKLHGGNIENDSKTSGKAHK